MKSKIISRNLMALAESILAVENLENWEVIERSFSDDESLPTIGLANIHAHTDVEKNKAKIEEVCYLFRETGVNIAIFPEFCLSSYFWEDEDACWKHMEKAVSDRHYDWFQETLESMLNDNLKMIILNNIRRGPSKKYYNSTYVINEKFDYLDPEYIYDKTFLPGIEKDYTVSGETDRLVVDTEWGRFGASTCYDYCFSQLYQEMSMIDNVDAVIQIASWRGPAVRDYPSANQYTDDYYGDLWDMLMPSTSARNQMWTIAANACGTHEVSGAEFHGGSGLWTPSGMKIVQATDNESLVIVRNVDVKGERQKEKDDFDYAEDFDLIYDIVEGKRSFSRI